MSDNIIQIKDWMRSPAALKGLDRQILDLSNKLEELLDSKEQNLSDLEGLFQWAIDNQIKLDDPRFQNSLDQFVDAISLDEELPKITSFNTITALVETLDELIFEKVVSLTEKRLEALRLKWQILNGKKG
ncbi:hypothetical protein [Candidatus Paracaedibacter symbiosus]|uniref:hypothetical protein n=1 Tax=Candidatus Paracaedibacter symbiosus TaxID=244582 RepID=UPI0005094A14|nr:hypothetical protein [Candidatus Paracaedibacter symbiosus]